VRNPSRSESFVSEATFKLIDSENANSKMKTTSTENKIPITRRLPIVADIIIFLI
jgi:hypothetical protein